MKPSRKIILSVGLITMSIGFSGCSSSSDDDGGADTTVKITQDNAVDVASAVMTTVRLVGEFSQRLGSIVELLSPQVNSASFLQARAVITLPATGCGVSGTQTLSGDVADPTLSSLAVGEQFWSIMKVVRSLTGLPWEVP